MITLLTFICLSIQTVRIHPQARTICYLTQAIRKGLFIGCIGTHAHGRQEKSKRYHVIMFNKIDKSLVVYRFLGNVMTSITNLRT